MKNEQLSEVIDLLSSLESDYLIPKNIRFKIKNAHSLLLSEDHALSIRVDRSMQELDDVADDPNVPVETKTQLWNLFSKLEAIQQ
jgi:uncharacterized protein